MEQKRWHLFLFAAAVLLILFIAYKRARNAASIIAATPQATGVSNTTPGMLPDAWYMTGGNDNYIATPANISVNVHVDPWAQLSQQYEPLFGFVGVAM